MSIKSAKPVNWLSPSLTGLSHTDPMAYGPADSPKRHAACDECRQRKSKCTGDPNGCGRCVKQGLFCHYSFQKQMGRPPKARATSDSDQSIRELNDLGDLEGSATIYNAPDPVGTLEATKMCPAVHKTFMKNTYDLRPGPFMTNGPIFEHGERQFPQQAPSPEWTPQDVDYSHINPILTQPPSNSGPDLGNSTLSPSQSQALTPCSCLSHLYLSLSSLSTLYSFPLSPYTLGTLYTAARTAQSVINCEICPQTFSSGIQNLMLLGTHFNVIADGWLRLSHADAEELGKATVSQSDIASLSVDPEQPGNHWEQWLRQVVRHGVVGSSVPPAVHAVQSQCIESPSLLSLIEDVEERQRQRHAENHKPPEGSGSSDIEQRDKANEKDTLCVRIVGSARMVIDKFGFKVDK